MWIAGFDYIIKSTKVIQEINQGNLQKEKESAEETKKMFRQEHIRENSGMRVRPGRQSSLNPNKVSRPNSTMGV
jgi:hypothetical protein